MFMSAKFKTMQKVQIKNNRKDLSAPLWVKYCDSFLCQLRGLTFRKNLSKNEGLFFVQKRESRIDTSIHMMFVFIDLGVVWLNSKHQVVDIKLAKKWHLIYIPSVPAQYFLEISPERLSEFQIGDQLSIEKNNLD